MSKNALATQKLRRLRKIENFGKFLKISSFCFPNVKTEIFFGTSTAKKWHFFFIFSEQVWPKKSNYFFGTSMAKKIKLFYFYFFGTSTAKKIISPKVRNFGSTHPSYFFKKLLEIIYITNAFVRYSADPEISEFFSSRAYQNLRKKGIIPEGYILRTNAFVRDHA